MSNSCDLQKKYRQKYQQSKKGKATRKAYRQTEKYKIARKAYRKTEKAEAAAKKYNQSEQGKLSKTIYRQTEKGITAQKRYAQSEKGRIAQRKSSANQTVKYPKKHKARQAVNDAICAGAMPRPDTLQCSCGKQAREYHHHSYAQRHWLEVTVWCVICHKRIHCISVM